MQSVDLAGLLLQVERRAIAVEDLPLAGIAGQIAGRLQDVGTIDLEETALALQALSRLMLLKSEALLPRSPVTEAAVVVEDDVDPGAHRLDRDAYEFPASRLRAREGSETFPAVPRLELVPRKIEPRSSAALVRVWTDMYKRQTGAGAVRLSPPSFVRLEVALSRFLRRLRSGMSVRFSQVVKGANRNDLVVHFLALLELIRRQQAEATQMELFGDIAIEARSSDGDARSRAG